MNNPIPCVKCGGCGFIYAGFNGLMGYIGWTNPSGEWEKLVCDKCHGCGVCPN